MPVWAIIKHCATFSSYSIPVSCNSVQLYYQIAIIFNIRLYKFISLPILSEVLVYKKMLTVN